MHVGVAQPEVMPDFMDHDMRDKMVERFTTLAPFVEDGAAVEEDARRLWRRAEAFAVADMDAVIEAGEGEDYAAFFFPGAFFFAAGFFVADFLDAAFFLAGAFLPGLTSSGCTSRFNPSRSARRVTMSAYASASEDDGPLAATPSTLQRSRTSAFVIPSSFASSWILIFFAATLSIQPFTVVFASRMLESMRIRMFVTIGPTADSFSDRVFVVDADVVLPRSGERPT